MKKIKILSMKKMILRIGKRIFEVKDLDEAVEKYSQERDLFEAAGRGGSRHFPDGKVAEPGINHRISYNGRLWKGEKHAN